MQSRSIFRLVLTVVIIGIVYSKSLGYVGRDWLVPWPIYDAGIKIKEHDVESRKRDDSVEDNDDSHDSQESKESSDSSRSDSDSSSASDSEGSGTPIFTAS
ncbi:hypothetical protein ACF0H5_000403 [Mactra antiquata]